MAQLVRFAPLDGVPDADQRGAGTFHYDDGSSMVAEDPELADLVKSYQDTLPQLEALHQALPGGLHSLPDQRLASNDAFTDPSILGTDAFGGSNSPAQVADFLGNAKPDTGPSIALREAYTGPTPGTTPSVAPPPGSHAAETAALSGQRQPGPSGAPGIQSTASDFAPPPSDASRAAELHRLAGEQALRGAYVPGQRAGYSPGSRTGALDPEVARRQAQERGEAGDNVLSATEQARADEADLLRKSALQDAMRIEVQKAEQQRVVDEAEVKRQRLQAERKRINDEPIDHTYAQGNHFRQALALLGSALLGATGSDAGLRMIQGNIDGYVDQEMKRKGSRLQALAEDLGSEEQAIAGAKAKLWGLVEKEAVPAGKLYDAAKIEHQTPAVVAEAKARRVAEEGEYERQSLGKKTEVYHQGRVGGRTGPNLGEAAKQYEAANKLTPKEEAEVTAGLSSDEEKDFRTRMEGIADAEHALNEIDQNIGIQRDAAGNATNKHEIGQGNIEGAGFLGGRTPNAALSEKGSALNRAVLRMTRANVKATSGFSASDEEFTRAEKDTPLTDEKDLVNALDEKRRELASARAKAQTLYGGRVDRYLGGYRGNRARIGAQRGQSSGLEHARGRVLQLDRDDPAPPEEPEPVPTSQAPRADSYETRLSGTEEQRFDEWRRKYVRPGDTGEDYDFRGAFKAGLHPDPENGHWPDTFKKPNHPTFSNESKYAKGQLATYAGHWKGETFVPPKKRWGGG